MTIQLKNPIPLPLKDLAPGPDAFVHWSTLHGVAHVARVIIHSFLLVDVLGLHEESTSAWAAAYVHDIGRTHDGRCNRHGAYALKRLGELAHVRDLLIKGGVADNDWEVISVTVEEHCREDLPKNHPYWLQTAILKDADGLDRVRLGDLNAELLRFSESRELIPFARKLYAETDHSLEADSEYLEKLWPVAQRILGELYP